MQRLRPRHDETALGDDAFLEELLVPPQLFIGEVRVGNGVQKGALRFDQLRRLELGKGRALLDLLIGADEQRFDQACGGRCDHADLTRRRHNDAGNDQLSCPFFVFDGSDLDAPGADLFLAHGDQDFGRARRRRAFRPR